MVGMKKLNLIIAMLAIVLMTSFVSTAQAEFKRNYTQAKKSFEDGNFDEAIRKFSDAISDNPESAARVKLYGMRYDSYIPHYFLGEAYFKLNDCTAALAAWDKALEAGVIQKQKEFAAMQTSMASCKTEVIDVSGIAAEASSSIDLLDNAIGQFAGLQSESLLRSEWSSKWQPEMNQSKQLAQTLRQRLDLAVAESDADAIKAITNEAGQGVNALSGSERLARAQIQSMQSQNAEAEKVARTSASQNLQNSISRAKDAESYDGGSTQMASLMKDLERQIQVGESLGATASVANIREQTQIIGNVLRRYDLSVQDWQAQQQSIAERIPPADLKRIAEAYFSGDYQTVSQSADPDKFDKDRARIQALLFRAAANHKLYVRTGEKEDATLRKVESDIRAIKQLDRKFSPYIAAFSPRFLALFRQTG